MEFKKMLSDSIWDGGDTQELQPLEVKPSEFQEAQSMRGTS